jgi:DNA mismatch repair protein MutS2
MISENTIETLEFDKLLSITAGFAHSEATQKAVLNIRPLKKLEDISKRTSLISEIRLLSQKGNPLSILPFPEIADTLQTARPAGAVLEPLKLVEMMDFLSAASHIFGQIHESTELPLLNDLTYEMTGHSEILRMLKKSIDSEGNILDTASAALKDLRSRMRGLESRIRKKLEELVRDERTSVFLQDDFITQRSGRWVIPVRMDSKGQIQGVVHDVSRSGETAFMEPLAIISLSNELENLSAEAKAEEIRILRNISSMIRGSAPEIYAEYEAVVHIDMLNCIALLADTLKMEMPKIGLDYGITLTNARHPLLMLSLMKKGTAHHVIPLNVRLGNNNTVMVITGPNAGGKTITIKTIGLLIIMALSGMPVPADSSSSIPFTSGLLIDIGDQQSIENSMSTFSAHLTNIADILKNALPGTIALIDELGTGTDPDEGAAIACAVLNELMTKGALVFATTHLMEIKGFVHKTDGMLNASMEFDRDTFTPLYKLRIGEPGRSYAFETAKRFGLPEDIIKAAKNIMGVRQVELDNLIHDLNEKRRRYEEMLEELAAKQAKINDREQAIYERETEIEKKEKEKLKTAFVEASEIVSAAKRQMNELLEELKKRDREKIKDAIKQADVIRSAMNEKARELEGDSNNAPDGIIAGDTVFVRSIGYDVKVVNANAGAGRIRVRAGSIEMEVPLSDISAKKGVLLEISDTKMPAYADEESAPSKINLMGLRADDAIGQLEPFLNRASLSGYSEVVIVHGVGTGALAKAVREHLKGHPLVNKFRAGGQTEGGAGVTIVSLN